MPRVAELTDAQCKAIRGRYEQFVSLDKLREEFGWSRTVITSAILRAGGKIRRPGPVIIPRLDVPVFNNKLEVLSKQLRKPLNDEVLKTLVDYVLGFNDGRTFRKIDRRYGYEGALSQFRKDHLEASYYIMGCLWRAVYRSMVYRNVNFGDYGVAESDVRICRDATIPKNRREIRRWVKNTKYIHLPNEDGVHAVVQACEKTMKSIVGSKLRFIYQYDPCYEKDDLIGFLRIVAYRVAVKYDWEMLDGKFNFEKCLNYTKRSMWNAAYLLIKQNTSDDYKRLARVDTEQRLYQITTISMDSPLDDEWTHIQRRLGEPEDRSIEVFDLVDRISQDESRFFDYLRLEIEDVPGFDIFIKQETGQDENNLYNGDYKLWRELALRFSGISREGQRKAMKRRVLRELGMWDSSKMKKPKRPKKKARSSK